jgi:hypothetical protein
LYFPYNPFLLALLREHPPKTSVVCRTPEGEIEKEKNLGGFSGQGKEKQDLEPEQSQV